MRRRTGFVMTLAFAALPALWGCAGGPPYRDPEWPGYTWGGRSEEQKADPAQVQHQLAALTAQLSADLRARQAQRIAVLPFENTSVSAPEPLGAYLTEKITHLFYADRVGTIVERTYLKKVVDEIERGYSGPFDPLSLKEIGHLLNADTLILGSYTRLANGTTEVMARAVFVETGEVVGAGSAMLSGKIVPNAPVAARAPLLAQMQAMPEDRAPTPRPQGRRILEQAQETGPGTFNIAPSPAPGPADTAPQVVSALAYPTYPIPQAGVPFYGAVPQMVAPVSGYTPTWRPAYSIPGFARTWVQPRTFFRPSGRSGRKR